MNSRYLQFITWALCILMLVSIFLYAWEDKSQPQVEKVAFEVAQREILSIANNYKELWLINGSPDHLQIDGNSVYFTESGWPYGHSKSLNCQQWLDLLWLKKDVLWLNYEQNQQLIDSDNNKKCQYTYQHGYQLELEIVGTQFNVKGGLAE